MLIARAHLMQAVRSALRRGPVTALLGPRQCGKTTLARLVTKSSPGPVAYFDLEEPADLRSLETPMLALGDLRGLVVIDECQRMPELFPALRVLADRPRRPVRFLLLGSASPDLIRSSSETLAGRIAFVEMNGLTLDEVGVAKHQRLWLRGGLPRSFLARSERDSVSWRRDFVRTFLERDLPQLGITIPARTLHRYWTMLAHFHGRIWNAADLARSMGTAEATARRYLDLLTGAFVVRQLQPWHENLGKRQVKAPKVYIRDTGLLHELLSIPDRPSLLSHSSCGLSWEGFAIEQVLARAESDKAWFWSTHSGAELDLLVMRDGRRWGFEFKTADAPAITRSMRVAMQDLKLHRLLIVYPGARSYALDSKIEAVSINDLARRW